MRPVLAASRSAGRMMRIVAIFAAAFLAVLGGTAVAEEPFSGWRLRAGALVCPSAFVAGDARTALAVNDRGRFAETGCFFAPRTLEILPVEAPGWRDEHEFDTHGHLWRAHIYTPGSDGPAGADAYFDERDAEGFARAGPFRDPGAAEHAFVAADQRAGLGHVAVGPPGVIELIVGPAPVPPLIGFCHRLAALDRAAPQRPRAAPPVACRLPPLPPGSE